MEVRGQPHDQAAFSVGKGLITTKYKAGRVVELVLDVLVMRSVLTVLRFERQIIVLMCP